MLTLVSVYPRTFKFSPKKNQLNIVEIIYKNVLLEMSLLELLRQFALLTLKLRETP